MVKPGYYHGYCEICGRSTRKEEAVICPYCRRFVCSNCTETYLDQQGIERVLCKECYQERGGNTLWELHPSVVLVAMLGFASALFVLSWAIGGGTSLQVTALLVLLLALLFLGVRKRYGKGGW